MASFIALPTWLMASDTSVKRGKALRGGLSGINVTARKAKAALTRLFANTVVKTSRRKYSRYYFTGKDRANLVRVFNLPAEYLMAREDGFPATTSAAEGFVKLSVGKRGYSPYKNLLNKMNNRQLTYMGLFKLT